MAAGLLRELADRAELSCLRVQRALGAWAAPCLLAEAAEGYGGEGGGRGLVARLAQGGDAAAQGHEHGRPIVPPSAWSSPGLEMMLSCGPSAGLRCGVSSARPPDIAPANMFLQAREPSAQSPPSELSEDRVEVLFGTGRLVYDCSLDASLATPLDDCSPCPSSQSSHATTVPSVDGRAAARKTSLTLTLSEWTSSLRTAPSASAPVSPRPALRRATAPATARRRADSEPVVDDEDGGQKVVRFAERVSYREELQPAYVELVKGQRPPRSAEDGILRQYLSGLR